MTKFSRRAFITGITGQDGSYLAELLLSKGYEVFGLVRRSSTNNLTNITDIEDRIRLIPGDMLDEGSLAHALEIAQPDEVYNLAAQSFVGTSWAQPILTGEVTGLGVQRLLNAVRQVCSNARFYQASSSEMFGGVSSAPCNEDTPFHPRSPYGVAKVYGHYATVNARESYSLFAVSGILFNHESPRRGLEFVTRKVVRAAVEIKMHLRKQLSLGPLDSRRDWGFAGDYVRAMWMMLQQDTPQDFVIATGRSHTVEDLCRVVFSTLDMDYKEYVKFDTSLVRPSEVHDLVADPARANLQLDWGPTVGFKTLLQMMIDAERERLEKE